MTSADTAVPFRIAIVGGGIGGLFCALAIHHHCSIARVSVQIDVYEQAAQYKEIGAGVGVGVNAARLIHKLGIGEQLNAIAGHRRGVWIRFSRFDNSEDICTVPVNDNETIRQAPCARSDLLDLLLQTVNDRKAATLHTKKAFHQVENLGHAVRLHFADESTAEADVLVGCDGIHSKVRSQFIVDNPIFSAQQVLNLLPDEPSKWKLNDREPLNKWHHVDGKVILLGDAANAMLPHLGAGAGQAMESGWILGRALSEHLSGTTHASFTSLERSAQLYQDVRLPRAQKAQRTSRAAGDTYEMQAEDMLDKSYEECIPMMAGRTRERMKWVWEEDLDAAYKRVKLGCESTAD
ncbi:hypothetical protein KC338_g4562 [Hortaea werneckii]|nr:hypothetical protein KC338_g4562 [Hortaea werneckii]